MIDQVISGYHLISMRSHQHIDLINTQNHLFLPLLFRMRSIIPTAHNSDSPLLRQPITPTTHYSNGPFFRQCKIELNPQIHGLTRCIQQDVPSVRLILTNHGLDRMFWKGKGAFILGCTSPFKAIMIDRPGMGKVKN